MAKDKTATLVARNLPGFRGVANLYRCDPPMQDEPWSEETSPTRYEYVIASAAYVMFSGPETYLFGADVDGNVLEWCELPGSYRGGLDHTQALLNAGYSVVESGGEKT